MTHILDVQYGTESPPDDPHWDDPAERRGTVTHARWMGWTAPSGDPT